MKCAMPARIVSAGVVVSAHVLSMGSPSPSDDGESLSDVSAGALSSSVARRGPDSTTVGTLGVDNARPPPPPPAAAAAALPAEAGNAERGLSISSSSPENSACPGAGSRRENDRRLASSGSSGGTTSTHPSLRERGVEWHSAGTDRESMALSATMCEASAVENERCTCRTFLLPLLNVATDKDKSSVLLAKPAPKLQGRRGCEVQLPQPTTLTGDRLLRQRHPPTSAPSSSGHTLAMHTRGYHQPAATHGLFHPLPRPTNGRACTECNGHHRPQVSVWRGREDVDWRRGTTPTLASPESTFLDRGVGAEAARGLSVAISPKRSLGSEAALPRAKHCEWRGRKTRSSESDERDKF
jgi:hypothetical protein